MAGRTAGFCRGTAERGKNYLADVGKMPDHHVWSIRTLAQRVNGSEGGFCPRRFSARLRLNLLIYWEMNRGFPSAPKKPFCGLNPRNPRLTFLARVCLSKS